MSLFDLDPVATQNALDRARMNPLDPETMKPGWFAGMWKTPVTGLASSFNDAALLLGDTATPVARTVARPVDQLFGTKVEDWLLREQQKAVDNIKDWAPDPRTTGIASQAVHGIFNIVPQVLAGGPEVAAALQGYKGFRGGMAEGLDPGTAFGKGAIDGVSTWVGLKIPMTLAPGLGSATNVAAGAVANVPVGMVSRGVTGEWLRARGYPEMADQYKVLDESAIAMDLIMGGGFGAMAHYGPKGLAAYKTWREQNEGKLLPTDRDTALYLNNVLHAELDTAPGIPADPAARAAHNEALTKALEDLLAGRDVTAPESVTRANFVENPSAFATREEVRAAVEQHLGPEWATMLDELERRGLPTDESLYQILPGDRPPVRFTDNITSMLREWEQGGDTATLLGRLRQLQGQLERRAEDNAAARMSERERGPLWIRERLLRAERNGEITPEARGLVEWLLDRNPAIANDLAISMREAKGEGGSANYNPAMRLVTLFKNRGNDETAAHEVLHHGERLMPEAVRQGVRDEWIKQLEAVNRWATENQVQPVMQAVDDAIRAAAGDRAAYNRLAEQISKGEIPYEFYQFVNPSEFWAVNAARLVNERANAGGWVGQAVQWLKEFVEKVKATFGLRSDAPIIRGLDAVLKSDGQISGRMIGEGDIFAALQRRMPGADAVIDTEVKRFGFTQAGPGPGEYAIPVSGLGDVIGKVVSAPGEPLRMEISPEYLGRRFGSRIAEGDAAINAAIEWASDGIQQGRQKMAAQVIADERGLLQPMGSRGLLFNDIARRKPGVESPGVGVASKNLNGFEPNLRVKVPGRVSLPKQPLILTGTNAKNAARQIGAIDNILARFPNADSSPLEWSRMMAYAMATADVPIPPYRFLRDINSDGALRSLERLTAGQIEDANHGFENARAFREAYTDGTMQVEDAGKLFMWSFLSRGVSPYTQEGLFIDAFPGVGDWIKKAAEGNFTERDFKAYEAWAKSVAPKGSGQPGSGATHNLNAFGKLFLFKMGERGEDGVSRLQKLHDLMADPNQTGPAIRRWFIENAEGVGIDNKVVSFTLLVAGFPDVMVLDRVQIRQLWDDGRFGDRNLYDGRKQDGKAVAGTMLSELTYGARGLLVYEAVERALAKRVDNLYTLLGRPQDASIGRYHWETWVADSAQEASHGTLDAILAAAKGDADAMAGVTAKEGEYGGYAYGARYGRDAQGAYFLYTTPLGTEVRFPVPAFREFLDAVKSPKNKVVPTKFKVTEAGNAPWYERPEVNKQALDELAKRYGREAAAGEGDGAVQAPRPGEAVSDQPGRGAGAFGPDYVVANNPSLTIVTADGRMIPAARALADADAEITSARRDSQGYEAAVACALRG